MRGLSICGSEKKERPRRWLLVGYNTIPPLAGTERWHIIGWSKQLVMFVAACWYVSTTRNLLSAFNYPQTLLASTQIKINVFASKCLRFFGSRRDVIPGKLPSRFPRVSSLSNKAVALPLPERRLYPRRIVPSINRYLDSESLRIPRHGSQYFSFCFALTVVIKSSQRTRCQYRETFAEEGKKKEENRRARNILHAKFRTTFGVVVFCMEKKGIKINGGWTTRQ